MPVFRRSTDRLASDERGNLAVISAILIVPLMAVIAVAIDYSNAAGTRAKLLVAANAAALEAVIVASRAAAQDSGASFAPAETAGIKRFAEAAAGAGPVRFAPVVVSVRREGLTFSAIAQYVGVYDTFFSGLIGISTVPVSGEGTAAITLGPYADLQIMLDASESMLMPASPADAGALAKLTTPAMLANYDIDRKMLDPHAWASPNGCAVACHWSASGNDFYGAARKNNVVLRLDQMKGAIQSIAGSLAERNADQNLRLGLYTFTTSLAELAPPSTAIKPVGTIAGGIAPAVWPQLALGHDTSIAQSVAAMSRDYLSQAADGSTAASPRKYVLLMTDGMEDAPDGGGRKRTPLDPAACTALKQKGAAVFVMRTAYVDPRSPLQTKDTLLDAALRGCASNPTSYFNVNTQAEVDAAVASILAQIAPSTPAPAPPLQAEPGSDKMTQAVSAQPKLAP